MAVIGKIRRRSGLLIIIIGLAMLAFILGDLAGTGGMFNSNQQPKVGTIDDVEIDQVELEQRTEYWSNLYATGYNQNVTKDQARNIAWNDLVKEKTLMKDIRDAGFNFTVEEFDDLRFGEGVLDEYKTNYVNESGQFDPERVKQTYSYLYNEKRPVWEAERRRLENTSLENKYKTLVAKTLYATDVDAKADYNYKNGSMDLRFVVKKFSDIADSTIQVSDSELNNYFNAHKGDKKYKQTAGRDLEFVVFDVRPTADDIAATREQIESDKLAFASAPNDSLFLISNSDDRKYVQLSWTKADIDDSAMADSMFKAAEGTVFGPIQRDDKLVLMKVIGDDSKQTATVRHILLNSNATNDAEVSARADSLKRAIQRGADFEKMVEQFTDDPGSKATGGKYEDFPKGQMVPEFEDFSFNEPVGALGVVKTTYGYHIIENLDRKSEPMKKVVELVRYIEPSAETFNAVYDMANNYTLDNDDAAELKAMAESNGKALKSAVGVTPNSSNVAGINNARPLVTWAYENERKVGDISIPLELGDKFIVAALTGSREDGLPRLSDIEDQIKAEVIKEKKAQMIKDQFGQYDSLEEAATNVGATVQSASAVTLSTSNLPGAGREPEVVGAAMAYEMGDVLTPLIGNSGVIVVEVGNRNMTEATEADINTARATLDQQYDSTVKGQLDRAIQEAYGVKNDIARYY